MFFLILNNLVLVGIVCIVIVWIFIFVNMFGGIWVSCLIIIGLVLVFILVVMIVVVGWYWFDVVIYQVNWNIFSIIDSYVVIKSILFCLWVFVGVEFVVVSIGMVKNLKCIVLLVIMLGIVMVGIVYIVVIQVIVGMYFVFQMVVFGVLFVISVFIIFGGWVVLMVFVFIVFVCLIFLGLWMMLVGQVGVCVVNDGNFLKVYGEVDNNGILKKGLLLVVVKMIVLMVLIILMNFVGGKVFDLFGELIGIVVLLIMLFYFYFCVDLICFEGINICNFVSLICLVLGCVFCFIVLMGVSFFELVGIFIVSLIILMFYGCKMYQCQNNVLDNNIIVNVY